MAQKSLLSIGMIADFPTYEIHPRANGEGYDLTGPLIPPRVWRVADYVEGYAAMLAKTRGGIVRVYDAMGELVREHFARDLNGGEILRTESASSTP